MSITTQPTVNVLNGSLACAFNDGRPTGSNELVPSIVGNALFTPTWDVPESAPPFGNSYNGVLYFNKCWAHYGQLYTSNFNFQVLTSNNWLANFPAFKDLGSNLGDQHKVLKLYGGGTNFPDNTGDKANTSNTRGTDGGGENIALTAFSETAPAGTFPDSGSWTKQEWGQGIDIPDNATKVKFGAYIRVPSDDDFRANNCSGIYIHQTVSTTTHVNAVVVKRSADTISLVTGAQSSGVNSAQQWSGLSDTLQGEIYPNRDNVIADIGSITYVDSNDYKQFRKVEKEVTLETGTSRRLGYAMFFAENQDNLDEADPAIPTGSTSFYSPFVQFFDSSDNLIITKTQTKLILKHTGYGSARVTINGLAFDYDGTDGLEFPLPIKTPNAFRALFNAIGVDAIFDGNPSITGGTYIGDIDEAEGGTLDITWDGTSDEIVITTNGLKD
jgi:hypothetical protein